MLVPPAVTKFFIKLLLCYALFLGAWPLVASTYATAFRTVYTKAFQSAFPKWYVAFVAKSSATSSWDSELLLHNPKTKQTGAQPFGTRYLGYAATSMLFALLLASPVSWGRRGRALIWGVILVHLWIAFSLWLMIVHGYSGDNTLAIYDFGSTVKRTLSFATFLATESTAPRYLVPVFLWITVTFRKGDWEAIFKTPMRASNSASRR